MEPIGELPYFYKVGHGCPIVLGIFQGAEQKAIETAKNESFFRTSCTGNRAFSRNCWTTCKRIRWFESLFSLEFVIIENPKIFSYINHIIEQTTTPKLRHGINGIYAFIFSA